MKGFMEKACEVCGLPALSPLDFWETPDGVVRTACEPCQGVFQELSIEDGETWLRKRGWLPPAKDTCVVEVYRPAGGCEPKLCASCMGTKPEPGPLRLREQPDGDSRPFCVPCWERLEAMKLAREREKAGKDVAEQPAWRIR